MDFPFRTLNLESASTEDFVLNQPLASPSIWKSDHSIRKAQATPSKQGAFEIKFLVDKSLMEKLIPAVAARMQLDPHVDPQTGGYSVEGIYFETLDRDVYRGTPGYSRRKYRIRRYSQGPNVFLERKSKRKGIVTKRRLQLKTSELTAILNGTYNGTVDDLREVELSHELSGQTEIAWFLKRIERLKLRPTLCIAYDRVAFLQMENLGPIRLTIDRGLGCCLLNKSQFPCLSDYKSILAGKCVVELKYREVLPTVFRELIQEFKLMSQPVSKFRNAIAVAGLATSTECVSSEGIV